MLKIAISGKANSGKNTLASMLSEALVNNANVTIDAFANPIKEIVLTMFPGAQREELFGPSQLRANRIPGTGITYRQALLDVGKFGRNYDENMWVKVLESHINRSKSNIYIVTDLRFTNEFSRLQALNFTTIRIKRSEAIKIDDISETEQDSIQDSDFHFVIENNGSIQDLRRQINDIAIQITSCTMKL